MRQRTDPLNPIQLPPNGPNNTMMSMSLQGEVWHLRHVLCMQAVKISHFSGLQECLLRLCSWGSEMRQRVQCMACTHRSSPWMSRCCRQGRHTWLPWHLNGWSSIQRVQHIRSCKSPTHVRFEGEQALEAAQRFKLAILNVYLGSRVWAVLECETDGSEVILARLWGGAKQSSR